MRSIRKGRMLALFALMTWCGFRGASNASDGTNGTLYVTWPPVEPDKAIAAWLIIKYVSPDAHFAFVERGTAVSKGIPFDIPGSKYIRDQRRCTSEAIIQSFNIPDEKANRLASLARRIEIAYWAASFTEAEAKLIADIEKSTAITTNSEAGLLQAIKLLDGWSKQ